PALFGRHPSGAPLEDASLCVQAPAVLEVRVPARLIDGAEFVTTGTLHPETGKEGSVQLSVSATPPGDRGLWPGAPVVAVEGSAVRNRLVSAFDDFRTLFPAALCYTTIVPVDEVVTLTLFYREDEHLKRLMLDDAQAAHLDRL